MARLPLAGVRVISMEQIYAAPLGTQALAALGAEVIRVESASRPDSVDPAVRAETGGYRHANRNKRAVSLDLQFERGRELFKALVAKSDVVVENYTRRVMINFGLDYDSLRAFRPDLIMLSVTGYGHTGPYADYKAFGPNLEAMAGQVWLTGYEPGAPHRVGGGVFTDTYGGHAVTLALLSALVKRKKTGRGSYIDLSLYEVTASMLGESLIATQLGAPLFFQEANRHQWMAPHGCFPCLGENRWVAIAVASDAEWEALAGVLGEDAPWARDHRFATARGRYDNQAALEERLSEWTRTRTREEVARLLTNAGVSATVVQDARDAILNNLFWTTRSLEWVEMSQVAPVDDKPDMAPPWHFSRADVQLTQPPPIQLGQDNGYVFGEILGLSAAEIAALEDEGVLNRKAKPREPRGRLGGQDAVRTGAATAYDVDHRERIRALRGTPDSLLTSQTVANN